jgi:phage-related protein
MEKPIKVVFLKQAEDFTDSLDQMTKKKIFFAIHKVQERLFGEWFEKLQGSDGIFEFRVNSNNKWVRLFAFWDTRGESETLIIGTHGIFKKTNKTPKSEIDKAEQIKRDYFQDKFKK